MTSCTQCGQPLAADAGDALACPGCLLEWGLGGDEGEVPTTPGNPGSSAEVAVAAVRTEILAGKPASGRRSFGDYELIEEVARGGMGIVYKARQASLNRIVAVKMVLAGGLASGDALRRFRVEAEAAARLRHPHIVGIHEVGELDGFPFFSMDFVEGRHLGDLVREGPVPARQAADWMRTVAGAIQHAHRQGVLHRDLKPSNILLDLDGQPHVTDFGLAKQIESQGDLTISGQVLGTPNYMSPEQALGRVGDAGVASDVYALGAVLYHLLTGRPPFAGQSVAETIHQVVHGEVVRPSLLVSSVPVDLETICLKCLEREPARRYPTAAELEDELGRFLRDEPIRARPVSDRARFWRWCRRNPVVAALAGGLLLALLLGLAGVWWQLGRVQAGREQVRRELTRQYVANGAALLQDGDWFKSLLWFVEAMRTEQDDPAADQLHRQRIGAILDASPRLVHVLSHDGMPVGLVAVSEAGDLVATAAEDRVLRIWDLSSGRERSRSPFLADFVSEAVFSPDGASIAVVLFNQTVSVLEVATGRERLPPLPHRSDSGAARVAPVFDAAGQRLALRDGDSSVRLWDVRTGEPLGPPWAQDASVESIGFLADGELLLVGTTQGWRVWEVGMRRRHAVWETQCGGEGPVFPAAQKDTFFAGGAIHRVRSPFAATNPAFESVGLSWRRGGFGKVRQGAFDDRGERFAAVMADGRVRLWNTRSGDELPSKLPAQFGGGAIVRRAGRLWCREIATRGTRWWDLATGVPLTPFLADAAGLPPSSSGRFVLALHPAPMARVVCVWELPASVEPPALLQGTPWGGRTAGAWVLGKPQVSGGGSESVRIEDAQTGLQQPLHPVSLRSAPRSIRVDSTGRWIIFELAGNRVEVWDAVSGMPMSPPVPSRFSLDAAEAEHVRLRAAPGTVEYLGALARAYSSSALDGHGGWRVLDVDEFLDAWRRTDRETERPQPGPVAPNTPSRPTPGRGYPIDLTEFVTHSILGSPEAWTPDLDLPAVLESEGVAFHVRGGVGLFGSGGNGAGVRRPPVVSNIRVGRHCAELHFLHVLQFQDFNDSPKTVAAVRVEYAGGSMLEFGITNLVQVVNDYRPEHQRPSEARTAWAGTFTDPAFGSPRIELWHWVWQNPFPERTIVSVALRSERTSASYNLLGLTAIDPPP